jgi:hypothetical protein
MLWLSRAGRGRKETVDGDVLGVEYGVELSSWCAREVPDDFRRRPRRAVPTHSDLTG